MLVLLAQISNRVSLRLTSCDSVDFMLKEKVCSWNKSAKEGGSKDLPVLDSYWVRRTNRKASQGPRNSGNKIANHEDVVPHMVVCRCNIGPSSTGECSEDSNPGHNFWQGRIGSSSKEIVQGDESESRTGGQSNANHIHRTFRISIANGGRDGGEPLLWVAIPLILHDLFVVKPAAYYKSS